MRIVGNLKGGTTFGDLHIGDVFVYNDTLYMKVIAVGLNTAGNAVTLERGGLYTFILDMPVTPRKAEVNLL